MNFDTLMGRAIEVARTTPPADVPVGAVLYDAAGHEIAATTNRRDTDGNPLGHAEVLAVMAAGRQRLEDCTLVVTLEPCAMCAGALVGARLGRLIFGAFEPRTGAVGSVWDVVRDPAVMHRMEVRGGVREAECASLVQDFFARVRICDSVDPGIR